MITLLESSIITFPLHKFAAHMLTYTFQCHDVIFSAKIKETILSRCFVTSLPLGEIWYPWWVNCTYEKWNVETKIPERFLIIGFHFFRFVLFCFFPSGNLFATHIVWVLHSSITFVGILSDISCFHCLHDSRKGHKLFFMIAIKLQGRWIEQNSSF